MPVTVNEGTLTVAPDWCSERRSTGAAAAAGVSSALASRPPSIIPCEWIVSSQSSFLGCCSWRFACDTRDKGCVSGFGAQDASFANRVSRTRHYLSWPATTFDLLKFCHQHSRTSQSSRCPVLAANLPPKAAPTPRRKPISTGWIPADLVGDWPGRQPSIRPQPPKIKVVSARVRLSP